MAKRITQAEIAMEYFTTHPNQKIHHSQCVDWLTDEYRKRTGKPFADPDRQIRTLAQKGKLKKLDKGFYEYDPDFVANPRLEDFTQAEKEIIFKKDNYRCVMCARGPREGVEIHADHIRPKDLGGEATIENGQTLCAKHNFLKKNLNQTETGKKMFIHLYELSQSEGNTEMTAFCERILEVFDEYGVNDHIEWTQSSLF